VYDENIHKQAQLFKKIFDEYSARIYRHTLIRTGFPQDAEDITSQTFLKLWEVMKGPGWKHIKNPTAFLYTINRNLIIDLYRYRSHRKSDESIEEMADKGKDQGDLRSLARLVQATEYKFVLAKLRTLPTTDQELLLLRFVDDAPVNEIAKVLKITPNNASVKINRAIHKLKELVNKS